MILQGKVISGQKIANKFGVATANIEVFDGKIEEDGVYIVECSLFKEKGIIQGLMHYGQRKTADNKFSIEVHLLDFSRNIYGEVLEINVLQKLREIEKFDSMELLFSQIKKDIVQARKFFLRRKIKSIWKNLPVESREILARKALEKVSKLEDFLNAENIYIYAPNYDEIDFVSELCEKFPEKTYFFPKIIKKEMKFFSAKFSELKVGKWGILEPITPSNSPLSRGEQIEPDLIFVPAVGADFAGNRLGNGGGFYDRFLNPLLPLVRGNKIKTICVLPEFAVSEEIPVEEHDEKVDGIVVI